MEEATKIHVGLDVHKDSITTAAAAEPGRSPARVVGKIAHDVNKLVKVLEKLEPPTGFCRSNGEGERPARLSSGNLECPPPFKSS